MNIEVESQYIKEIVERKHFILNHPIIEVIFNVDDIKKDLNKIIKANKNELEEQVLSLGDITQIKKNRNPLVNENGEVKWGILQKIWNKL